MTPALRHWAATHPGAVRRSNQDAFLSRPEIGLFAVADGVGGSAGGGFASSEVVRRLAELPRELGPAELLNAVRRQLQAAHETLRRAGPDANGGSPATTVVVVLVSGRHLTCVWIGDSRAYVLRDGRLTRLTADHSLVEEMVRAGRLTDPEAGRHPRGNVITRAIGAGPEDALIDKVIATIEPGDRILLCSDGLLKALPEETIAACTARREPGAALLDAALVALASDNVTAVVVAC